MIFEFEKQKFDTDEIKQLYPAAMIPTGEKDELTQISLEWYDTEAKGKVKALKYAIFFHLSNKDIKSFFYKNRQELELALIKLSKILN